MSKGLGKVERRIIDLLVAYDANQTGEAISINGIAYYIENLNATLEDIKLSCAYKLDSEYQNYGMVCYVTPKKVKPSIYKATCRAIKKLEQKGIVKTNIITICLRHIGGITYFKEVHLRVDYMAKCGMYSTLNRITETNN
jgi:hypothetical protein